MGMQLVRPITAFFRILPTVLRKECQSNGSYPLHLEGTPCRGNDNPPPVDDIQHKRPGTSTRHTCVFLQCWLRRTSSALMTTDSTRTVTPATSTGNVTAEPRNSRPVATDWPSTPPTPSSWQRTAITCTTSSAATGQDLVSILTFATRYKVASQWHVYARSLSDKHRLSHPVGSLTILTQAPEQWEFTSLFCKIKLGLCIRL